MSTSLSTLLEQVALHRTKFPLASDVCQAVICLNAVGKIAAADEPVVRIADCLGEAFIEVDGVQYCRACWTPTKAEV